MGEPILCALLSQGMSATILHMHTAQQNHTDLVIAKENGAGSLLFSILEILKSEVCIVLTCLFVNMLFYLGFFVFYLQELFHLPTLKYVLF